MSDDESKRELETRSVNAETSTSVSILNSSYTGPPHTGVSAQATPLTTSLSKSDGHSETIGQPTDTASPLFISPNTSDETLPLPQSEGKQHVKHGATPAVLLVSRHTSISEESLDRRVKMELMEEEPTERSRLIENGPNPHTQPGPEYTHTQAYEKLGNVPTSVDPENPASDWRQGHGSNVEAWHWLCFWENPPRHPITSRFTNEAFRQAYTGEIFKIKSIQLLLCFLVSITSQSFWGWDWNVKMGTPTFVLRIEEHRWIVVIPFSLYVTLIGFIRLVSPKESRSWPFNQVFHIAATVMLCLISFMLSVGFGDLFYSGIVPVTLGSLCIAYFIFRRLIMAEEDDKFWVDVSSRGFYYAIPTLITAGMIISWPIVSLLLWVTGSSVGANENIGESLLWEGIPAIPIGGIILFIEVYHIQELFAGRLVSVVTEDQSEVLFTSFFI